jgi:hypothetical protein
VTNHDFTQKNPIFSNFRGGGGAPGAPPPGSAPVIYSLFVNSIILFVLASKRTTLLAVEMKRCAVKHVFKGQKGIRKVIKLVHVFHFVFRQ